MASAVERRAALLAFYAEWIDYMRKNKKAADDYKRHKSIAPDLTHRRVINHAAVARYRAKGKP